MPFDNKQPVLIVMMKRDATLGALLSAEPAPTLPDFSVDVCGGNEEASAKAISESIITSTVCAAARLLMLLIRLISVNFNE